MSMVVQSKLTILFTTALPEKITKLDLSILIAKWLEAYQWVILIRSSFITLKRFEIHLDLLKRAVCIMILYIIPQNLVLISAIVF